MFYISELRWFNYLGVFSKDTLEMKKTTSKIIFVCHIVYDDNSIGTSQVLGFVIVENDFRNTASQKTCYVTITQPSNDIWVITSDVLMYSGELHS